MKRLGLFLSVLVLIFNIATPNLTTKVSAVVTETEYNALKNSAQDFDFNFETVNGTTLAWVTNYPSTEYLKILRQDYESLKADPKSTKRSLEVQTLNQFIVYLNETIPKSTGDYKSALEATLILAQQKFDYAVSAVQLENGTITQDQHRTNLTNANNASNSSYADRQNKTKEGSKCSIGVLGSMNLGACISEGISWIINNTLLEIAGFLVWVTANMLNYSIQIGILDFASWAPDSLYPIWTIVRQILSLLVVFAGLYLGFMYILGKEDGFEKYIPWVVIFALFINFSYPLTRTAIDLSNVISLKVYSSAVGGSTLGADVFSMNSGGGMIMNKLGLQGLIMSSSKTEGSSALTGLNSISGSLAAVFYVLYAAYIFLMATGIIVMRTVSLIFIIVASPLLFVDSVIPKLGEKAQQLRKVFFNQLLVGPVFMIMLALTLKILDVFKMAKIQGLSGSGGETIATFFNILVMLAMLHVMLKVTRDIAGETGNFFSKALGNVGGFVGGAALGAATGGAGLLARGTLGRGAAAFTQQGGALDRWQTKNGITGAVGRRMYNFTDSIAKSGFDARNTGIVQKQAQKLGLSSGMGAGVKKGYQELQENKADRRLATREKVIKQALKLGKTKEQANKEGDEYIKREMGSAIGSRFLGTYGNKKLENTLSENEKVETKRFNELYGKYITRSSPEEKKKFLVDTGVSEEDIQKLKAREQEESQAIPETKNELPKNSPTSIPVTKKDWDNGIDFTTEAKPSVPPLNTTANTQPQTSQPSSAKVEDTNWKEKEVPAYLRKQKASEGGTQPSQPKTEQSLSAGEKPAQPTTNNTTPQQTMSSTGNVGSLAKRLADRRKIIPQPLQQTQTKAPENPQVTNADKTANTSPLQAVA